MADSKAPMMEGTTVGQIQTPMNKVNVDRKNTPSVLTYESTMDKGSGSSNIIGPGKKGSL
tara:strand:- start:1399 stop:1578 length:180 start_codon:yes stop_codon:yes gene_type:complete